MSPKKCAMMSSYIAYFGIFEIQPFSCPFIFPYFVRSDDVPDKAQIESILDDSELLLVYLIFILPTLVIFLSAFADARFCRINHYFSAGAIFQALIGFLDFASDIIFAVQLNLIYISDIHGQDRRRVLFLTLASYICIILPMILGFIQLLRQNQKKWVQSVQLRNWMKKYSYFVYIVSVLSGSAFNTVAVVNCEAFGINIFSMGLSKRMKEEFNSHRIWSVVVFEVTLKTSILRFSQILIIL